jgi:uncharacterized protein YjbI with pentapeptide repeats
MANPEHLANLEQGVPYWNRWREVTNHAVADLSDADLSGKKLHEVDFVRVNLTGANLTGAQIGGGHLKDTNLTGAMLNAANFEGVNARGATFDAVTGRDVRFQVSTLRGATFRGARLPGANFHRAYLRDSDLTGAHFENASMRFARFDNAICRGTDFQSADLRYASFVSSDLRGARLMDVQTFGVSAWNVAIDGDTRQDLIICKNSSKDEVPLRTNDIATAQLLSLMLDGAGMRSVVDSVNSKLVLILGSFAPQDKAVLDALRTSLQDRGYVGVTFDFERPAERDYAETIVIVGGLSRFVIADFTNAKEVRAEVAQLRSQYRRVPVIPIARAGAALPVTMANVFSPSELKQLVRYAEVADLTQNLLAAVIDSAEAQARQIAESIAESVRILRGN